MSLKLNRISNRFHKPKVMEETEERTPVAFKAREAVRKEMRVVRKSRQ